MATYLVGFDGEWQERFGSQADAEEWAVEVAETGRTVFVLKRRLFRAHRLVAVFPKDREKAAMESWAKMARSDWASTSLPPMGGGF